MIADPDTGRIVELDGIEDDVLSILCAPMTIGEFLADVERFSAASDSVEALRVLDSLVCAGLVWCDSDVGTGGFYMATCDW